MEGNFSHFMTDELRTLLADIEAGLEPSNIVLAEVVRKELQKQFRRTIEPAGTVPF